MENSKPAIKSVTIWGGGIALLPGVIEFISQVSQLPIIPAHVAIIMSSVGSLLAIYGRIFGGTQKISGIVSAPKS